MVVLDEPAWKDAPVADKFIALRPTPFKPENPDNARRFIFYTITRAFILADIFMKKIKTVLHRN